MGLVLSSTPNLGEGAISFGATMYLMWDPAKPGPGQTTCAAASNVNQNPQPSTCTGSIPISVASMTWGFNADAINPLTPQANNPTWILAGCSLPSPATPTSQKTSAYPTWTSVAHNQ
jgi:hypothetical protein